MHTSICDRLGIEFPIFAFSHCRDVVAAVSQAGGFGVLGALGFTAEELEVELQWIDSQVGDRPYGVDVVMPSFQEGRTEGDPREAEKQLAAMIPSQHRDFVARLLEEHGVPELPEGRRARELIGWVDATAKSQVHVALGHPKVRLIANTPDSPQPLGMPLQYMVTAEAVSRTAHYASRSQDVAFNAGGQVLGLVSEIRSTRDVIYALVEEYLEAVERLQKLSP